METDHSFLKGQSFPANSRKNSMQAQNVQKQMPNTSQRVGGVVAESSGSNSMNTHQKANKYGIAPNAPFRIFMLVIWYAPFCFTGELWPFSHLSDILLQANPIAVTSRAAMACSMMLVMDRFMAGSFGLKLGNCNRKGTTPATNNHAQVQVATESVAGQGA
jgi:hypothetical protein